jgi:fucose permease
MMAFGLNAIVAFPVGIIADHVGERATLAGLGAICFAVVATGFLASTRIVFSTTSVTKVKEV